MEKSILGLCREFLWIVAALTFCACAGLRQVRSKPWATFTGEVSAGRTFEQKLPNGFIFRLQWNGETGYIEVDDPAGSGKDLCAVATPPYHGLNNLSLDSDVLLQSEDEDRISNFPGRRRFFHCVMTEESRREATWALFGWRDKAPFDKAADQIAADRAARRYVFDAAENDLSGEVDFVQLLQVGSDDLNGNAPSIGKLKFTARFDLPKNARASQ
jgi:hypothetical protein